MFFFCISITSGFYLRVRPFNLKGGGGGGGGYGFLFRSEMFFSDNTKIRIFFFCRAEREFVFPEFNIRLYDKNSESDYFFFPAPKSEYFVQQHWESEFFKKNPQNLRLQVKWSFPTIVLLQEDKYMQ